MEENKTYLLDSNIIIYASQPQFKYIRLWIEKRFIAVSDISRIEVLGYKKLGAENKSYFEKLFTKFLTIPISEKIILKSIQLKQQKTMNLGDAIIAATALSQSMPLLTANSKDFTHIKELKLINLESL